MTNLIVTILSIVLVAITVAFGLHYVSDNFGKNMAQVRANIIKNEASQIYTAATQYMLDKGLSSFDDFNITNIFSSGYLPNPYTVAGFPVKVSGSNAYLTSCASSANPSSWDNSVVNFYMVTCAVNGVNIVNYAVKIQEPYSGACSGQNGDFTAASSASHPVVKMCLALNAKASLPAGLTYAASGIPYGADGSAATCHPAGEGNILSGSNKFGYCYLQVTSGTAGRIVFSFAN